MSRGSPAPGSLRQRRCKELNLPDPMATKARARTLCNRADAAVRRYNAQYVSRCLFGIVLS
jgi:hypothetical protein